MQNPLQATAEQMQSLIQLGYVRAELLATLPMPAVLTRAWWLYFHPDVESDLWLDLDAWINYCDRFFPDVDAEALDMALGCC
jgi:hypothetical protein